MFLGAGLVQRFRWPAVNAAGGCEPGLKQPVQEEMIGVEVVRQTRGH
jgi:hypothetical protein